MARERRERDDIDDSCYIKNCPRCGEPVPVECLVHGCVECIRGTSAITVTWSGICSVCFSNLSRKK